MIRSNTFDPRAAGPKGPGILDPQYLRLPIVPHKAVAEVSKQEAYRRGWLLWIKDGRAKPLMDLSIYLSIYPSTLVSLLLS